MEIRSRPTGETLSAGTMAVGAVVAVWGSFQPWLASGSSERSSYELLGLVERLGVGQTGPTRWAIVAWPLMPVLVVLATVLVGWRRHLLGVTIGVIGGVYTTVVALVVGTAPGDALVRSLHGTTWTVIGGALVLAGALSTAAVARGADRARAERPAGVRAPAPATRVPSPSPRR